MSGIFTKPSHKESLLRAEQSVAHDAPIAARSKYRQSYHFMAPANWINDPNGMIFFRGEYHMFYQYNPYGSKWNSMHWGHAKSSDLVHWEHLPIALAPSEPYDWYGCFSGTAFEHNGKLYLFYCGTYYVKEQMVQCQCMAYSEDGVHFTKSKANPIVSAPPSHCTFDFRDPNVFEHEGKIYMLIASSTNGHGCTLIYTADDDSLEHWTFKNNLAEGKGDLGDIWEDPFFYPIDGKHVLTFSAMHADRRKVPYLIGDMDFQSGRFYWDSLGEMDWGFDYYAPQIIKDGKGRYVSIAWMNAWRWAEGFAGFGLESSENWCGFMSIPREIKLDSQKSHLIFQPVEELKSLRGCHKYQTAFSVEPGSLFEIPSECIPSCEMNVVFNKEKTSATTCGIIIKNNEGEISSITWDVEHGMMVVSRKGEDGQIQVKSIELNTLESNDVDFHVFIDTCSVEIFATGGKMAFAYRLYGDPGKGGLYLYAEGGTAAVDSVDTYTLSKIEAIPVNLK